MFGTCPVCKGNPTVISVSGVRAHWCPRVEHNVWWYQSAFLVTSTLTLDQVHEVIVGGKRIRDVVRK